MMKKVIAARLADAKEPPGRPERQPESPLLLGFRSFARTQPGICS